MTEYLDVLIPSLWSRWLSHSLSDSVLDGSVRNKLELRFIIEIVKGNFIL